MPRRWIFSRSSLISSATASQSMSAGLVAGRRAVLGGCELVLRRGGRAEARPACAGRAFPGGRASSPSCICELVELLLDLGVLAAERVDLAESASATASPASLTLRRPASSICAGERLLLLDELRFACAAAVLQLAPRRRRAATATASAARAMRSICCSSSAFAAVCRCTCCWVASCFSWTCPSCTRAAVSCSPQCFELLGDLLLLARSSPRPAAGGRPGRPPAACAARRARPPPSCSLPTCSSRSSSSRSSTGCSRRSDACLSPICAIWLVSSTFAVFELVDRRCAARSLCSSSAFGLRRCPRRARR